MLERVSQFAEQAATSVSRRQFLHRFGRGALMTAGTVGAFFLVPGDAEAARPCPPGYRRCTRHGEKGCCRIGNRRE